VDRRIGNEWSDDLLDHLGFDERFVALDVQHDVARQVGGNFRDAIGAGAVRCARHPRDSAKGRHRSGHALVIGGHDYGIHAARGCGATINMLDHGTSSDIGKGFAR
jgi:hypothetical protein